MDLYYGFKNSTFLVFLAFIIACFHLYNELDLVVLQEP